MGIRVFLIWGGSKRCLTNQSSNIQTSTNIQNEVQSRKTHKIIY